MNYIPTLIAAFVVSSASAQVTEYEHAADEWMSAAPGAELRAFDEFYPGIDGLNCIIDPPGQTVQLHLDGGTITVSAFDELGEPLCPIFNGSPGGFHSDGRLLGPNASFILEFEPGIHGFYTYYGSFQAGIVTMHLYADEVLIETLDGPEGPGPPCDVCAVGHGFLSVAEVDRIEFTLSAADLITVGVFPELVDGEPSLGSVFIPAYGEPPVPLDFGCLFHDLCPADIDGSGVVGYTDLLFVLAQWGPCPELCVADVDGDGQVAYGDLLIVLSEWGPCDGGQR